MLTIFSGTNRRNSMTLKVAQQALHTAQSLGIEAHLIDLSNIPNDFIHAEQYNSETLPTWLKELQAELLIPATHFLFVTPEYNGSFPGYLKLFIDAVSVDQLAESFTGKYAAQIGVASGRAGNVLGMDHLTSILVHLNCRIVPGHLPISGIDSIIDTEGKMQELCKTEIANKLKHLMNY